MVAEAPMTVGAGPAVLELEDAESASHEVAAQVEVRSCREVGRSFLVGATILEIDPDARLRLMEWCYVVCSHERLRGHRPAAPIPETEAIVVSLDDHCEGLPLPVRPSIPAMRQAWSLSSEARS